MRQFLKKVVTFALVMAMLVTTEVMIPQNATEVKAATAPYINPFSAKVVTYKTGDIYSKYSTTISIMGCGKASEIKKLKSSNKDIKVSAQNGYIRAEFGDKAGKATITCTVKNVKLKTTLTVKKYASPVKSMKLGSTNFTSKFKNTNTVKTKSKFSKKKLAVKMNSGWVIKYVSVYNGGGKSSLYTVNGTSFSKTISLTYNYGSVYVSCYNNKTKVTELMEIRYSNY